MHLLLCLPVCWTFSHLFSKRTYLSNAEAPFIYPAAFLFRQVFSLFRIVAVSELSVTKSAVAPPTPWRWGQGTTLRAARWTAQAPVHFNIKQSIGWFLHATNNLDIQANTWAQHRKSRKHKGMDSKWTCFDLIFPQSVLFSNLIRRYVLKTLHQTTQSTFFFKRRQL